MEKSRRHDCIPATGLTAQAASELIRRHLASDAEPALNLAGYHNTFMEREIEDIMFEHLPKNITHHEAYPASNEIERDCVTMIAELFNSPVDCNGLTAVGTSTVGSSEAIILAVLAAKRRWEGESRLTQRKSTNAPNMIASSLAHVCWQKAALYLGIELRFCGISENTLAMEPHRAIELVDENTILIGAVLGSSLTGTYDDVQCLNDLLMEKNHATGLDIMIHVDAASGGFVAPFLVPELEWDFRLPLVSSINVSGHKCKLLTYASVGWALWRSKELLPQDLLFTVDYCGASHMVSFTLNFSKSAVNVIGQYYQLMRLGKAGYEATMRRLANTAEKIAQGIGAIQDGACFRVLSKNDKRGLPVVLWCLKKRNCRDEYTIARQLRTKGWIIPAYEVNTSTTSFTVMRVIVRTDLTEERCTSFLSDLSDVVLSLEAESVGDMEAARL
ncbi:uncharacterized protein MYCFIDRAFT_155148 [Pseudocercospora fijiensis CIRAD86]|uniref:Glutamate decarboxylase n=1 Tax=Pseudocercospora fijiensis (strain CIRAD86) TaxID=383855 RepID=M3A8D3_PSEFD|nr:uncharacterized protein MYCFIDRAFT_155148 [Pseudocercospora fijiensis CIRAD86]EME80876.1 hypothetical protein MYCFIDRAFT_155148 [Pseudocercospora fijiensis CIRAD86]